MKESAQRQNRRTKRSTGGPGFPDGEDSRARKAIDERCQAVRRWIDDDDDDACRGID
jgi:hypothetical protein